MNNPAVLQDPVLYWLKKRSQYVTNTGNWDWILRDPIVGHLVPALFLLDKKGLTRLSEKNRQEFSQIYWNNKARWIVTQNRLMQVLSLFYQAGVTVIPLKGAAFKDLLYKDIGLRPMSDVDLLVASETFLFAINILGQWGFRVNPKDSYENITWFAELPKAYWPKELSFSDSYGLVIELHHALITSWFQPGFTVDMDAIWKRSIPLSGDQLKQISPESLWKRFLSPYDTLAFLCLHLAMHGLKFPKAYFDVDLWIRNLPERWDWDRFIEIVNAWQIRSAAYHVLSFCREFMATPLPDGLLERIDPGWLARWRVGILITSESLLANSISLGSHYPTLVKIALIDRLPRLVYTLLKVAFPNRSYYYKHPSRRSLLGNWLHIFQVVKRGD